MKKAITIFIFLFVAQLFIGCGKPLLDEFEPRSPTESAVKETLIVLQDAFKNKNIQGVLDIIHPSAKLIIGKERMVLSKAEYAKILPDRIDDFPDFEMSVPKVKIKGDEISAKVYFIRSNSDFLITYYMICEKQNCKITRWEY